MMSYKKGDTVLVNFNPQKQKVEVGKVRPAIVVSDTTLNDILDLIIVVPLTTNLIDDTLPLRVRIPKKDNLHRDSDAMIENIRAISKNRVSEKISSIKKDELTLINDVLKALLELK